MVMNHSSQISLQLDDGANKSKATSTRKGFDRNFYKISYRQQTIVKPENLCHMQNYIMLVLKGGGGGAHAAGVSKTKT